MKFWISTGKTWRFIGDDRRFPALGFGVHHRGGVQVYAGWSRLRFRKFNRFRPSYIRVDLGPFQFWAVRP